LNIRQQKVVKEYGHIHANIVSIAITSDDKYL
jgi:WD40 repeat protein